VLVSASQFHHSPSDIVNISDPITILDTGMSANKILLLLLLEKSFLCNTYIFLILSKHGSNNSMVYFNLYYN